jgi:trehalose/maltose transport system substrate-binding protein
MIRAARNVPLLFGVVLGFMVSTLTACAPSTRSSATATTRLAMMLQPGERPFWVPIAEGFEAGHPGVHVDLVEGPQSTDLRENLYTAALLAGDPSFDLVYMDVTWTSKFAAAGWLRPLDDTFDDTARSRFLPAALDAGVVAGRLYRIPVRTDVGLLYYRRDWLDRAGLAPPNTFADLERIARRLQQPPARWGYVWQGKQYEGLICDYLEVLRGYGGFWIDPATLEVGLDRPEAVEALRFLVSTCRGADAISPPGVTTYQEEESRRLFHDGRAVFLRNWPYVWRLSQRDDSPLRGKVGVMPMVHAEGGHSAGTLGGWGLGVSAFSRHPELAIEFIRHVTSLKSERMLCEPTGYAPARLESYEDSTLLRANPFLSEMRRIHEAAVPRPTIARYALASDILQRRLSGSLAGTISPEAALRAAARETRLMLGRAGGTRAGQPSRPGRERVAVVDATRGRAP